MQNRREKTGELMIIMKKIVLGKQEKPFHEMIIQIGNKNDMSAITEDGRLAAKILDEYMQGFQKKESNASSIFGTFAYG